MLCSFESVNLQGFEDLHFEDVLPILDRSEFLKVFVLEDVYLLLQVAEHTRLQAVDVILFHAKVVVMLFYLVTHENLQSDEGQFYPEFHHLFAFLLSSDFLLHATLFTLLQGFQNIFERGLSEFDVCDSF